MSYYLRYITTGPAPALPAIEAGLRAADARYAIRGDAGAGELLLCDELLAEIEIGAAGQALFDEDMGELLEFVDDTQGNPGGCERVAYHLQSAKGAVVVRVLWQDREPEATLDLLDPLWRWLFAHHRGLLQADEDGYYDDYGQVLALDDG